MPQDPRELVLAELRKQTQLLTLIQSNLTAMAGTLLDMADRQHESAATVAPASDDRLCDGPHGDPTIKAKDPRDWSGEPMTGRTFSECPPEYLELLADRYDYFAGKEPDEKKAGYNRLDARRARAWAARLRAGWQPPAQTGGFSDEQPGF